MCKLETLSLSNAQILYHPDQNQVPTQSRSQNLVLILNQNLSQNPNLTKFLLGLLLLLLRLALLVSYLSLFL